MSKPVQAVSRGTPIFFAATVGLLIAKYGFAVPISLLWALAPLWLPLAIIFSLLIGGAVLGGAGVGLLMGIGLAIDWLKGRANRKAGQLAAASR